ncbi:MAG: ABC transporter ATP-binding protein [Armatimonadota bacterium]|nr:ABC transporter ATP-binding protein [Armatimonadota bacterium]MDR7439943.1 ABC transporter ATP-binding protein [Armatimonadota bacterium]MDR7562723.1 ABC transporter ATP-binding protein [Armatimonadota bacterium]MDR7567946.1 ABC transporter ATP-binding protein [Armatimonadota bacterium]MDR7601022.1 ABC transporter ATP-binding protein [Armatimonadota bacterium]
MRTLRVEGLVCGYGGAPVLRGVSLEVGPGEVVGLLGRNGAGKTTLMRAIMGLVRPVEGSIRLDGRELTQLPPHEIPRLGIGYVPQGRRLFPELTVGENLRMGLRVRGSAEEVLPWVLELFPILRERWDQPAGTLSGGEQQMVAIARALCLRPHLLLLDEPLEGLMPALVQRVLMVLTRLTQEGAGVLLAEQRVEAALRILHRGLLLEGGEIHPLGTREKLSRDPERLIRALGVRRGPL